LGSLSVSNNGNLKPSESMVQKNSTLKFESLWDLDLLRDDKQNRIYQTYMVEPFKMMDTMM